MSNETIKYIVILCTTGNNLNDLRININSLENQDVNIYLIVVTQGNHDSVEKILQNSNVCYKHICDSGKGLSRARNIALKNVNSVADYKNRLLIFSDDDNWYPENSLKEAYKIVKNSNNSICVFQYYDEKKRQFPKA